MCTNPNDCTCGPANPWADLEDSSEWNGSKADEPTPEELDTNADKAARDVSGGHITSRSTVGRYKCDGCHGSGFIRVYKRGLGWGQRGERKKCWKGCNGTGYTKTSPDVRAKNRARAAQKRMLKAERNQQRGTDWLEANPEYKAWFERNAGNPNWSFPDELRAKLHQYGSLTPGQIGAIDKCIAKDKEREERFAAERAAKGHTGLDLRHMHSGYYAVPGSDTRLKVKIDVITKGKWAGWVFVKDGATYGAGKRYGKQRPGEDYMGEIYEDLKVIAADPKAAMAAYGKLVGRCGMCNRPLEDEKSIALGIGPVCAAKFG